MNFASQVTFTTDSDCEVLLHLYKEYGPHFLKKVKQIWIVPPSHHLYSYIWFYKSDEQACPHKFRKNTRKKIKLHFSRFLWTGCLHLFFMTLAGMSSSLQGIQWVFLNYSAIMLCWNAINHIFPRWGWFHCTSATEAMEPPGFRPS